MFRMQLIAASHILTYLALVREEDRKDVEIVIKCPNPDEISFRATRNGELRVFDKSRAVSDSTRVETHEVRWRGGKKYFWRAIRHDADMIVVHVCGPMSTKVERERI